MKQFEEITRYCKGPDSLAYPSLSYRKACRLERKISAYRVNACVQTLDLRDIDSSLGLLQKLLVRSLAAGEIEVKIADAVVARAVTGALTSRFLGGGQVVQQGVEGAVFHDALAGGCHALTVKGCLDGAGTEGIVHNGDAIGGDLLALLTRQQRQTLLGGSLLLKYFDLKKMAEKDGETFEYDREAVRKMVVEGFKEALLHPRCSEDAPADKVKNHIAYFSNMVFTPEEETAPLPAELKDVNPSDVYQFFYKNSSRYNVYAELYGASYVDDPESSLGRVQKLCREDAVHPLELSQLLTTSREEEFSSGITMQILKDTEYVDGIELFKEDIVPDTYHLYKVGSVSGIQEAGHVRVDIFGNNCEWLHLSGIAEILSADSCDVYLSIKFAGEIYGGSKDVQEAVYLDRAIIVRR